MSRKIANNDVYQLVRYSGKKYRRELHDLSIHRDNQTFDCCSELGFPLAGRENRFMVIDVCNGLVCLSHYYPWDVILWNPSIRKLIEVPNPTSGQYYFHSRIGFGFNPETNDYKVVCFSCPPNVAVYELSTGSWRKINHDHLSYINIHKLQPQAYFNGMIHWLGYNSNLNKVQTSPHRDMIVSFDMKTDVLGLMLLPDSVHVLVHQEELQFPSPNTFSLRVAVYGDYLSLIQYNRSNGDHSCCVWVMKEYGISESWTKQFTIDMKPVPLSRLVGFRVNGDVLLQKKQCRSVVSYNPQTKQVKDFGIFENYNSLYTSTFVQSLVLFKGINSASGRD